MANIVIGNTKKCGKCQIYKEFDNFHRDKDNKVHGCASFCKPCTLVHRRENAEYYNIARNKRQQTLEFKTKSNKRNKAKIDNNPAYGLLISAVSRSKKSGQFCDLELTDIVIPKYCPILEVEMKRRTPYAPSLDRIDSSKGYIKGNITVISRQANIMKNNATIQELIKFAINAPTYYAKFYN